MEKTFFCKTLLISLLLTSCLSTKGTTYIDSTYVQIKVLKGSVNISGFEYCNTDNKKIPPKSYADEYKDNVATDEIDECTFQEGWSFVQKISEGCSVTLTVQSVSFENQTTEIEVTSPDGSVATHTLVPPMSSLTLSFSNKF